MIQSNIVAIIFLLHYFSYSFYLFQLKIIVNFKKKSWYPWNTDKIRTIIITTLRGSITVFLFLSIKIISARSKCKRGTNISNSIFLPLCERFFKIFTLNLYIIINWEKYIGLTLIWDCISKVHWIIRSLNKINWSFPLRVC